ncbi:hypothetical protein BC826DRAFT_129539 [Russula brevipes]|nr:hypothetical protein BC826DRAFT_129539 [Russula brevipes]
MQPLLLVVLRLRLFIRQPRSEFSLNHHPHHTQSNFRLQSAFKFPPVLDFDHSDFAISTNNAPVRAYEYALNSLLEQLDAIDSDAMKKLLCPEGSGKGGGEGAGGCRKKGRGVGPSSHNYRSCEGRSERLRCRKRRA